VGGAVPQRGTATASVVVLVTVVALILGRSLTPASCNDRSDADRKHNARAINISSSSSSRA